MYAKYCKILEELALTLGGTQQANSRQLKSQRMIQEQRNWVRYDQKPEKVERRFSTCEMKFLAP